MGIPVRYTLSFSEWQIPYHSGGSLRNHGYPYSLPSIHPSAKNPGLGPVPYMSGGPPRQVQGEEIFRRPMKETMVKFPFW